MARFSNPSRMETIGSIKLWVRPNLLKSIPPDWVIADGSTLIDPDSPFNAKVLPDTVDRFPQGAPGITNLSGLGSYQSSSVALGGPVNHQLSLEHSHSVSGHEHSMTHTHGAGSHTHSISTDGSHQHDSVSTGSFASNKYADDLGATQHLVTASNGSHSHTGNTGSASGNVADFSGNTGSSGPGTDNRLSSAQDIRPRHVRLIYIIKVK